MDISVLIVLLIVEQGCGQVLQRRKRRFWLNLQSQNLVLMVLEMEPRTWDMIGKRSTVVLHPQPEVKTFLL